MNTKAAPARGTRVVIVAGSARRRAELRSLLSAEPHVIVIDDQIDLQRAVGALVVVDLEEGDSPPSMFPEGNSGLILLTSSLDVPWIAQLLSQGPVAVLRRDCTAVQLSAAMQAVTAGLSTLDPEVMERLLRSAPDASAWEPGEEELTPRETEVLHMMTAGLTNREIASTLGISEHTVKFHIGSIFSKLGTATRTEAVTEGLRRGLILL